VWDAEGEAVVDRYMQERPDADALALEANVLMIRSFDALSDALNDYFRAFQLTRSRYNVLRFLHYSENRSVKMSDISTGIRVSKTAITTLVNALVKLGLVSRTVRAEDRRAVYVALTPKGEECIQSILPEYLQRVSDLWSPLSDEEKARLSASLAPTSAATSWLERTGNRE
jgi:DNA-binding MarR family transcriptional regulator